MTPPLNRRDFLKLSGLLPLSLAAPRWSSRVSAPAAGQENVIVLVFDAFSASNISMYGYGRPTTPNIDRLAERAVVYHNHFAGSNYTTSGTATLLTGTLPWTHRALQPNGVTASPFETRNIFAAFRDFYRIAYTHNVWAYTLLRQFQHEIDELIPPRNLYLPSFDSFIEGLYKNDEDIASVAWTRNADLAGGSAYSLLSSHLFQATQEARIADLKPLFPRGLPTSFDNSDSFILQQAIDWAGKRLAAIPRPYFGYIHLLPPHSPYRTSLEFYRRFATDGYRPVDKPVDVFAEKGAPSEDLSARKKYDEYVLYVDKAFGDLHDSLQSAGLLENTWLVLTSDHGEMLERGMVGHGDPSLYQPVIRVPLLIFEPGRRTRMDVYTPTSAVDVLPTLAHLTGHAIPAWTEGIVLPPFKDANPVRNREIYGVLARKNPPLAPLKHASTMMVKDGYKVLYYFGYPEYGVDELVRLYDLQADPEEMVDLYLSRKDIAVELLNELKSTISEVNQPYL
jgi:arylsulfatase A-like enzyme